MTGENHEIPCEDRREVEDRRNQFKKMCKVDGTFLKVERDTVILRDGSRYTFVIEPTVPEIDDESLPPEAFKE